MRKKPAATRIPKKRTKKSNIKLGKTTKKENENEIVYLQMARGTKKPILSCLKPMP